MKTDITNKTSDRKFGLVFMVLSFLFFFYELTINKYFNIYFFIVGIALLIISILSPRLLKPLNLLWFYFGTVLHKIISPLILAFMFFCIYTPIGIVLRLLGKNILSLKFDAECTSYWIKRNNNSDKTNFDNQF